MFDQFLSKYNVVKQIPLFSKLSWLELQRIARKVNIEQYRKGELIAEVGSESKGFYCLVSGRLRAFSVGKAGKKENIEFLNRGMYFGIISLLTNEEHSLNFEAINDSLVLRIEKPEFLKILSDIPKLAVEISQSLSRRIRSKVKNEKLIFESKIISVYSPIAGSGSSSYAINLALNLKKETDKKVLFISIELADNANDANKTAEDVGPQWKDRSTHWLHEIIDNEELLNNAVIKEDLSVDFLHVIIDESQPHLVDEISRFVSHFVNTHHYVIVDLPNHTNNLVIKTLSQSDLIHLVTIDREQDLHLTRTVIDHMQEEFKDGFDAEKVKVLLSGINQERYLDDMQVRAILNYDVFTYLPHIDVEELSELTVTQNLRLVAVATGSEYHRVVRWVARQIGDVSVGIVLGGGAALGLAHIGVIRVLEEHNIPIDIIVGSSMGALIGSIWAMGANSDELEQYAREFEKKMNMLKLVDPILPIQGLIGGKGIRGWLKKKLGAAQFYETKIPFKCISYDLNRRQDLIEEKGSIVDAVHKSIAIPGIIKPIFDKNKMIIDGGVMNPLPTDVLTKMNVKKIIAVNVLQSPYHIEMGRKAYERMRDEEMAVPFKKKPFHFLATRWKYGTSQFFAHSISNTIVQTLQASEYIIASQSGNHADVLLEPDLTGIQWFELYRVEDLIRLGEEAARRELPAIKELANIE